MPHIDRDAPQGTESARCGNCAHWERVEMAPPHSDDTYGTCRRPSDGGFADCDVTGPACDDWEPKR